MMALLKKDFRNARHSVPLAVLLGVPLLLILQFTQDFEHPVAWSTAFWLVTFFSMSALFFRSFRQEQISNNFIIYRALKLRPLALFLSQSLWHALEAFLVGLCYLGICIVLWSPEINSLPFLLGTLALLSLSLGALGSLLGLMLFQERELLFSLFFYPLASPSILAAVSLSQGWNDLWFRILLAYTLGSSVLCAFLFDFFFDELSQSS